MVVPDMRRHVAHDARAAAFQLRHGVRRGCLDQVDLAGQQGVGARQILRDAGQRQAVELGEPALVPIGVIAGQLDTGARHQGGQLERAGAGGGEGELLPAAAELGELGGGGNQEPEHLVGEQCVDALGRDLHRRCVELAPGGDRRKAWLDLGGLPVVEVRRLRVQHLLEVPDHGIRVERRAVVERHVVAQLEDPVAAVRRITLPAGSKAGDKLAGPVCNVQLPSDERVVEGEPGKLIGAGAAVGLSRGKGDVGHGDPVVERGRGGWLGAAARGGDRGKASGAGEHGAARKQNGHRAYTPAVFAIFG